MNANQRPRYRIEPARPEDVPLLRAIEREAAALFRGWPVPRSVLEDTTPTADFRAAQEAGLLWVARTAGGEIAGFAQVDLVAGFPHLEEIDVLPAHGRRGVGRALLAAVCDWARGAGHASITLTAYRDIPWNAPFYESCGFRVLQPAELTPALAEIVREEAGRGLDPGARVVMRLRLD
jgi:GNAT superfamily N-acetyltransferase